MTQHPREIQNFFKPIMKPKHNTKRALPILLAVLIGCFHAPIMAAAAETFLEENFDDETPGEAIYGKGWRTGSTGSSSIASNGFVVVTSDFCQSKPNSLVLVNTNSVVGEWVYAIKTLSRLFKSNSEEPVEVSFDINLAQNNAWAQATLTDDSANGFASMGFTREGKILSSLFAGGTTIDRYTPNVWYKVRFNFTPSKRVYDVEVSNDGAVVGSASDIPMQDGPSSKQLDFHLIYLRIGGAPGLRSSVYFDNLSVVTSPETRPRPSSSPSKK